MEMLVKCDCGSVAEVPIDHVGRIQGKSKLTSRQVTMYLGYLNKLRNDPRSRKAERARLPLESPPG